MIPGRDSRHPVLDYRFITGGANVTNFTGTLDGAVGLLAVSDPGLASQASAEPIDAQARAGIAALAKLAIRSKSAEGLDLIRLGLVDKNPAIRAASARVTHVMRLQELLPELRKALSTEDDSEATREATWALASLDGTSDSDVALLDIVSRPALAEAASQGLVAGRGSRLASSWPGLKDGFEAHPASVTSGLRDGLHNAAGAMFASFAIRDGLERLAAALLSERSLRLPVSVAIAGATAGQTRIRAAAYFRLAEEGSLDGLGSIPPRPDPESLRERIARHLFEAAAGIERSEGLEVLVAAMRSDEEEANQVRSRFFRAPRIVRGLNPAERKSLLIAAKVEEERVESVAAEKFETRAPAIADPSAPSPAVLKTLGGHPLEFARSVIESAGCRGRERLFGGVQAHYGPGGRPIQVSPLQSGESASGCAEAALILGTTALVTDGDAHILGVLPQRPEYLGCVIESFSRPPSSPIPGTEPGAADRLKVHRVSGTLQPPRKTRNVAPFYPQSAKEGRIQGIVIVEAVITPTGCVSSLRVLRGVNPLLDLSALEAASGWRYTPTLVDGTPVPVIMTVTVNFRLN